MTTNRRNYALVGLLILAVVVQLSESSLRFGTRAIVDEKSSTEPRAGNNNENNLVKNMKKSTAEDVAKRNAILKGFANREYLYPAIDAEVMDKKIGEDSKLPKVAASALEFGPSNNEPKIEHKQLKRQQRTNANDNLFDEDIENMAYELFKLSRYQQEDLSKKDEDYDQLNYDYLMNELNSEDSMKNDEIKGSNMITVDRDIPPQINDADMNEFYKELLLATSRFEGRNGDDSDEFEKNSFEFDSMSDESESNSEEKFRVIKPKIHYKETFLSGDIYNKMLNNGPLKSNEPFSNIQPSSFPSNAQNNKYLYDPQENDREELNKLNKSNREFIFVSLIAGCTIAALLAAVAGGVCFYTVKRGNKQQAFDTKNGIFGGVSGVPKSGSIKSTSSSSSGDRRLAQSAQMFHYQHQKQQMIAMEKANNDTKQDQSDNSEGETEEGDYTVYECPGLAPTGEMEVKNPLFKEEFPSSSNLSITSMPPAYSTVTGTENTAETKVTAPVTTEQQNIIHVNETIPNEKNTEKVITTAAESVKDENKQ